MSQLVDCCTPAQMSVNEGREKLLSQIVSLTETHQCDLAELTGRILAQDIISPVNVPAQTNSAMDGFALHLPELTAGDSLSSDYVLVGESLAGHGFEGTLKPGEAVMITTGAPLPDGANTVVMKEVVDRFPESIYLQDPENVALGANIRQAGEDLKQGSIALNKGTLLRPQHQGLIASLGFTELAVYRQLKVVIFSTGDEVVAQGQALPLHSIYDTNRFSLHGLLKALNCEVLDLGILPDRQDALAQALSEAASRADVVISSGGVSVGDADYIKNALEEVGEIGFWRLNLRPGRPFAFGAISTKASHEQAPNDKALFFGLPGNPVAVMVTFMQLVQPALRQLSGEKDWQFTCIPAVASEVMRSREGRTDFHRGIYTANSDGRLVVSTTGAQGSGILRSMVEANCLIEIPDEKARINMGDVVMIQPFADLI